MKKRIANPGKNCWRIETAERCALLIDGESYFGALHDAILKARESVWILAWDIDSRLQLIRDVEESESPTRLLDLIKSCLDRNRSLHVYVLAWDFSMIYALEREWPPLFNGNWKDHGRLHFCMDDSHPVGGSQHQKLVVVDDALAFVGGIDPSKWRWDTSEHRPDDPKRIDPDGKPYPPFHDVMLAIAGDAAKALGELARERWEHATGKAPQAGTQGSEPWPEGVEVELTKVDIGIARTLPQYGDQAEVREIEQLFLDSIDAAKHSIYIENQYFTSARIADSLIRSLEDEEGPEIVMVLPLRKDSWLERTTMDVLRARQIRRLKEADAHDRFRLYYPAIAGLGEDCVSVHAKLVIVDDRLLHLGSANLSNRSLGLDSECDVFVEASTEQEAEAISHWRSRLLCEHLDCGPDDLRSALDQADGSLIGAIERLGSEQRKLEPFDAGVPDELERQVPHSAMLDPERPVDPDTLIDQFIGPEARRPAGARIVGISLLIATLVMLAVAWRWSPLGEWLTPERLQELGHSVSSSTWAPLFVFGAFVVGVLAAIPVTLLITVTALVFGPWLGLLYAFGGAVLSAIATYGIGRTLGRDVLRRIAGKRLNALSRRLGERGVLTIIAVRIVPVAPFVVINLVAGVTHIRFRDYLIGTAVGMAPGVAAITLFADGLVTAVREPSVINLIVLLLIAALVGGGGLALSRWVRGRRAKADERKAS